MGKVTIKETIKDIIIHKIGADIPFTLDDISILLPDIKYSTIKVNIKRMLDQEVINKSKNGIYYLPKQKRVLKETVLNTDDVITKKYIRDNHDHMIGYYSGINLARSLGLTTQTASVETIYSNLVADKKRIIKVQNQKFIINAPRYKVTDNNYKVLQVLDIIHIFDKVSEIGREKTLDIIKEYLKDISIEKIELTSILKAYPLKTQVAFYEIGVDHVIT
jgi:hypothetical protein